MSRDTTPAQGRAVLDVCAAEAVGQPTNTAVVDDGGNPVAIVATDETKLIGEDISQKKALTSVCFQADTRDLVPLVQPGAALCGTESTTAGRLLVFGGGVLLRTPDGRIAGGAGVSAGSVDEDHQVAEAGRRVFDAGWSRPPRGPSSDVVDRGSPAGQDAGVTDADIVLVRPAALTDRAPYAYAAVSGPGRTIHTAGACPLDAEGRTVAPGDVVGQAERVMANLVVALRAAGAELTDVVRTTVYVASDRREDLGAAWGVVRAAFGDHDAPSTLLGVTVLGYEDQLVEVDAVAVVPSGARDDRG